MYIFLNVGGEVVGHLFVVGFLTRIQALVWLDEELRLLRDDRGEARHGGEGHGGLLLRVDVFVQNAL